MSLALGFGLFGIFNAIANLLRNLVNQKLSAHLGWDMGLRLFRHLIRLPLPWFQKRRLADTISRFEAIYPIRDLIAGSLISTAIDALLAVTTLTMMLLFAPMLAMVACVSLGLYISIRLLTLPITMRFAGETLSAQIAESGKRIETIRGIQTIKVMSAESEQEIQWANKYADFISKRANSSRFQSIVYCGQQGLEAITTTLLIFLGAVSVIKNEITLGIFYAFLGYRSQFSTSIAAITEQLIQWRLSEIYSYRLADIVLNPRELGIDNTIHEVVDIQGAIEVDNLSFRYAPYEPFVFENISLSVCAGEFVAIIGPSGTGKSSLLKLICGLYIPTIRVLKKSASGCL